MKKLTCSRATRRQLFTAELTAILCANSGNMTIDLDKESQEKFKETPEGFYKPIQEAIKSVHEIIKHFSPKYPEHPFKKSEDPQSDFQKFLKYEINLKRFLSRLFKESGITLDLFDAVLVLTEKAYVNSLIDGSPTELTVYWRDILDNLLDFYELIDADFERVSYMKLGTALSEKIENLLNI